MFYNKTPFPSVAGPFTKNIITLLGQFPGLKVTSGLSKDTDAVLIGIVNSPSTEQLVPDRKRDSLSLNGKRYTDDSVDLKNSLQNRNAFYLPSAMTLNFQVRLILLRRPTELELELARSELASHLVPHSTLANNSKIKEDWKKNKIIFNVNYSVGAGVAIETGANPLDSSGQISGKAPSAVNLTHNRKRVDDAVDLMALNVADQFKHLVLYAF